MSDEDYSSSAGEAAEAWSDWSDDESEEITSLFSDQKFPTVEIALKHDAEIHNFDLLAFVKEHHFTSEYDIFKLINYIRSEVASGRDPKSTLQTSDTPWNDEKFLTPVLPDDGLLLHDWDSIDGLLTTGNDTTTMGNPGSSGEAQLIAENQALRAALAALQSMSLQDTGNAELYALLNTTTSTTTADGDNTGAMMNEANVSNAQAKESIASEKAAAKVDEAYFDSYASFDIHRQMLADEERTLAYREALEHNPSLIKGATVLDVGCGTGVLSMFAARGGAKTVVAVDGSKEMASIASANIEENNFTDVIHVASGRVETLEKLPGLEDGEKVDVLVSEWMGYALLFETMLDSVLHARDQFLKPGGAVLPDIARVYVAAGGEEASGLKFWNSVYGLSMKPILKKLQTAAYKDAIVRVVQPSDILSDSQLLQSFDLSTMAANDQDFTADFKLEPRDSTKPTECHALVLWFDVLFSKRFCIDREVDLSTSFDLPPTHWAQTVLLLEKPIHLNKTGGDNVATAVVGRLSMARQRDAHRKLDISVEYAPVYGNGEKGESHTQLYSMGVQA